MNGYCGDTATISVELCGGLSGQINLRNKSILFASNNENRIFNLAAYMLNITEIQSSDGKL